MKKHMILFLLLSSIVVLAQTTYVPDDNFEQALIDLGYDTGPLDDYVPTANIENIEFLVIPEKNISDLTGIEDFTALTDLYCHLNQIAVLDLSQNLNLEVLYCYSNQITSLNVTGNTNLDWLACNDNQLSVLDTSLNSNLVVLFCQNNQLTTLDLPVGSSLEYLYCYSNDLSNLNVSGFPDLQELKCSSNQITNLDVTSCAYLEIIQCEHNLLNYLDVSTNTNLQNLYCSYNQLSNLDLSTATNLRQLICWVNQMTGLDVSGCTNLERLYCNSNQLTNLDLSTNMNLEELRCSSNYNLTNIDVRNGNNSAFRIFTANYNPSLSCIFVDDKEASYLDDWEIDTTASFVETQAECDALGIEDIALDNTITLYPNPTKEYFNITSTTPIEIIEIYDYYGKLVRNYKQQEVYSVVGLHKGIYLVYMGCKENHFVNKLVVD